jgi:hypothetical protein
MRTPAEQFIQDITRNLQEWSPYAERLSPEKLQAILNRAQLSLIRELATAVNELQRDEE